MLFITICLDSCFHKVFSLYDRFLSSEKQLPPRFYTGGKLLLVFLILIFLDKTGILKLCSAPIIKKKRGNDLHILFVNCCISQKEKPRIYQSIYKAKPKRCAKRAFSAGYGDKFF